MNKFVKITIGVVILALLVALGARAVHKARQKDAHAPKAKIYPVVVSQMTPKVSQVELTLPYLAEVGNDKDVKLASRIAARVLSIKSSGSRVKKGELVVALDTTDIQSGLASTQAQIKATRITLDNLEKSHRRTLELLKVRGASIEQSQKEQNAIAGARASLNALRQKEIELKNALSYATMTSPVDGVISKTFATKGALSAPGKPLVALSAENGFYLLVRVPSDIPIKGVQLRGNTYPAMALGTTFNALAEYKVYPGDDKLTSGDRVEVNVVVYQGKGMMLPFDALLNKDGKSYVLEIEHDHATAKKVHIVQSGEEGVVVAEKLEGKPIVVAKSDILLKLTSGYRLKVKE